jgi:hypothetical protein
MLSRLIPAAGLKKITVTGAAGAAAVLLAAGCGTSPTHSSTHSGASVLTPVQAITLAAHQAKRINSIAFNLNVRTTGQVSSTLTGSIQAQLRPSLLFKADMNISAPGGGLPGGIQEIMNSKAIYAKISVLQRELGKPWVKLSYAEIHQATGQDFGQVVQQVQDYNPALQMQMLIGAKDVKRVGTQTIDGVKTTEYAGSYPASAAFAQVPSSFQSNLRKQAQSIGLRDVQFRVWIDGQNLPRKIIAVERGTSTQITVTALIPSINQPVHVTYPPAGEVATIPASALQG